MNHVATGLHQVQSEADSVQGLVMVGGKRFVIKLYLVYCTWMYDSCIVTWCSPQAACLIYVYVTGQI